MEGEWSWWCCAVFPLHASDDWVEGDRWLHSGWPRVPSSARGPARQMPRPLQGQAWGGECSDLAPPNDPGKELEGYQRGVPLYAFSPECITLGFGHFVLNLEIGVWGEPILCGVPKIYMYVYIYYTEYVGISLFLWSLYSDEPYCRDLFIPRSIYSSFQKETPIYIYIYIYIYIHIGNGFIHQYIVKNSFVQDIFNQPEICMFFKIYMAKMFQTLYQIFRTFLLHPNFKMYLYFVFVL